MHNKIVEQVNNCRSSSGIATLLNSRLNTMASQPGIAPSAFVWWVSGDYTMPCCASCSTAMFPLWDKINLHNGCQRFIPMSIGLVALSCSAPPPDRTKQLTLCYRVKGLRETESKGVFMCVYACVCVQHLVYAPSIRIVYASLQSYRGQYSKDSHGNIESCRSQENKLPTLILFQAC